MRLKTLHFILLIGILGGVKSKLTPVVQTTVGPVQGEVLKTVSASKEYSSFKGIPYGEPPVGYLRFKPPVPKAPWKNVLRTIIEGANCIQKDYVYQTIFTGSEDCLYLNIYTPRLDLEDVSSPLLPVMIWIHDGGYIRGYGNSSLFGPDFIIEENVVLVTFNYRLGPFGFLSLNHENATGNAGLKDQNLVLRWVKENIAKFGGNPNSVTLFGQSSGGSSADLHGLSSMSEGLFHRSISMSASPFCHWAFHEPKVAERQALTLAKILGATTTGKKEVLKRLYEASPIDIMKIADEKMGGSDPPFKPTIENVNLARDQEKFLIGCSWWKYLSGNFYKVPHLTGFVANEALRFAESVQGIEDMVNFARNVIKTFPSQYPVSLPITSRILPSILDRRMKITDDAVLGMVREVSDIADFAGVDLKQKFLQARSGQPLYYYRLSLISSKSLHKILHNVHLDGVAHGDDVAYLFYMPVLNLTFTPNDPEFIARKRMVRMWTNFAKYGNPTPHGITDTLLQGITWPTTDSVSNYLDFNENLEVKRVPFEGASWEQVKQANLAILPIQTGCADELLFAFGDLNPFDEKFTRKD